jgi:hypothetical protein
VSEKLDNLASAINEATHATTSQDRERKFAKVDTLAGNLAKAAREFAEVNSERVVDYGGYSELVILRTELFANMFGVPASVVRRKRHSSPSLDYLTENLAALFHDRR